MCLPFVRTRSQLPGIRTRILNSMALVGVTRPAAATAEVRQARATVFVAHEILTRRSPKEVKHASPLFVLLIQCSLLNVISANQFCN